MAKTLVNRRLQDSLFRNWVASVLMLEAANCALRKLVVSVTKVFFQTLKKPNRNKSLCDLCKSRWENQCDNPRSCPSGFLKQQLIRSHRFGKPVFQNTNFQDCRAHHWAVASCFMPYGYKDKTPDDTDFSGVLHVLINHIEFANHIDTQHHPGNIEDSIFGAGRDIRNSIMHASPLVTSDVSKAHYKDVLVTMLRSIRSGSVETAIKSIQNHDGMTEIDMFKALKLGLEALTKFRFELKEAMPIMQEELRQLTKQGVKAIDKTNKAATDLMQNKRKRKRKTSLTQNEKRKKRL